ncbi:MAG: oligosaccharide flippase family protein [Deltaproteobacteria bacterium]|nr:oligosaccharide flippase family protein [Deltaproteobacteria bacterium]
MALGRNVIASIAGQAVRAGTGILFVPIYVRYLGVESYGLIGMFAVLQAWLVLLDFGMRPALGREMARFTGGAHTPEWIRDLLRTVEVISISISFAVALGTASAAPWLAEHWVTSTTLARSTVTQAFVLMGAVTALRFVENIYVSSLVGLQRQVLETLVSSSSALVRGLGAIAVLAWVSPTIEAFFLWQCFTSLCTVAVLVVLLYSVLPRPARRPRFDGRTLSGIRTFASGILLLSFQSLVVTNLDKVLLSRLLPLKDFGSYALAGVAANALAMLTQPVAAALTPRLTEVATRSDEAEVARIYHLGCQGVAALAGAAAAVLMSFSDRFLLLWTRNPELAAPLAPLLALMVLGSLLNALGYVPYHLQLAHGWTRLSMVYNTVLIAALVPSLVVVVPRYGAVGAATVWALLNAAYLLVNIPLMHRRILPAEMWRWYLSTALPLLAAMATAYALRWLMPTFTSRLAEFLTITVVSALTLLAATAAAPALRAHLARMIRGRLLSRT